MTSRTLRRDTRIGEGENSGRWSIVRKIGDGGFAEVFEVKDTKDHEKLVLAAAIYHHSVIPNY